MRRFFKIFILIVVCYFLFLIASHLYFKYTNSYETLVVEVSKIKDSATGDGIIYKDEIVFNLSDEKIIKKTQTDGSKIGINSKIAQIFENDQDALKYENLTILEEELKDLEKVKNNDLLKNLNLHKLKNEIYENYDLLLKNIEKRKLKEAIENKKNIKYFLNIKDNLINKKTNFENSISKIKENIKKLKNTIKMPKTIFSKETGYFVGKTDGFEEECSLKNINKFNLEQFKDYLKKFDNNKKENKKNAKIIVNPKIYFKMLIPTRIINNKKINDEFKIKFKDSNEEIFTTLKDVKISYNKNLSLAIFEINKMDENLSTLRKANAEVIFKEFEGFKIPKNALQTNEKNETGVYVIEKFFMNFKKVEILNEDEDFIICRAYPSENVYNSNYLTNLDKIIVKGRDLYDKKPV